jgi:hypothetical protein
MQKICADQPALRLVQFGMRGQRVFHFGGAHFKNIEQIPVPALEILKHLVQLLCRGLGIEPEHPVDDMARPSLIGRVEVARLDCRLEWSDDDPGRIRA